MGTRSLKLIVWTAGLAAAVMVAGYVEVYFGSVHILTEIDRVIQRPQFEVALLRGASGGCGRSSIQPSMQFLRAWETAVGLRRASRLTEKTPDGLGRWETPHGVFWAPKKTALFYVLAEEVLDVYQSGVHRVKRGDIVLDCGANVGVFTMKALHQGAALVVAIEPVPQNVASLRRTFAMEIASGRVIVEAVGVWHKEDVMKMTVFDNSALDSFVMRKRVEEDVPKGELALPLTTVDSIVSRLNLARVDFIKMDVEGAERNALQGAAGTITRHQPRMSVATENLEDDHQVVPRKIREIDPQYAASCGICKLAGVMRIRPDILFFSRPRPQSAMLRTTGH